MQILFECVQSFIKPGDTILDIGPGPQTLLFLAGFPNNTIDTLGFQSFRQGFESCRAHYAFDLNELESGGLPPCSNERYNLIVFGEIIEHLYFPPQHVMKMFHQLQQSGDHVIIQTPNAVRLMSRLSMLRGRQPAMWLRGPENGRGHIREYTRNEVCRIVKEGDYAAALVRVDNAVRQHDAGLLKRMVNASGKWMPETLRSTITVAAQKN